VSLRRLRPVDGTTVAPWLAEVLAAVDGVKPSVDTPASLAEFESFTGARWPSATVEAVVVEGKKVAGVLVWRPLRQVERRGSSELMQDRERPSPSQGDGPGVMVDTSITLPEGVLSRSAVVIDALAIRAGLRNLGYGAEAVYCLEATYPDAQVYAAIPRFNGLALYFWLRVGYRPVRLDEDPAMVHDPRRLWVVSGLTPGASGALPAR
jgi:hypothetical protein